MTDRVVRTPLAESDVVDTAEYLLREAGLAVALRFVALTENAFSVLARTPRIGALVGLPGPVGRDVRRWHVEGFNTLILYRPDDRGVEIIRVLHGARDLLGVLGDAPP